VEKKMRFSYYPPSDELNIHFDEPRPCISKEISDEIYVRFDSETYDIVGLTILNFRHRFSSAKGKAISFELPILAHIELSEKEIEALQIS
jgi:uncharacterized protein YuzE